MLNAIATRDSSYFHLVKDPLDHDCSSLYLLVGGDNSYFLDPIVSIIDASCNYTHNIVFSEKSSLCIEHDGRYGLLLHKHTETHESTTIDDTLWKECRTLDASTT